MIVIQKVFFFKKEASFINTIENSIHTSILLLTTQRHPCLNNSSLAEISGHMKLLYNLVLQIHLCTELQTHLHKLL